MVKKNIYVASRGGWYTASHRVLVKRGQQLAAAPARDLREGDDACCRDGGFLPLLGARPNLAAFAMVEIELSPDLPIVIYSPCADSILTKDRGRGRGRGVNCDRAARAGSFLGTYDAFR